MPDVTLTMLVVNEGAGSATEEARRRVRDELGDVRVVDFEECAAAIARLDAPALVVAAGGDGTVSSVARLLIGTEHVLGIVPLGTYNNFALGLGIPLEVGDAIAVIKDGVTMGCAVGRVGQNTFLESALVGALARTIELGEAVKELQFGELPHLLARHARSGRFRYRITGDVALTGRASSIVVANTPSTGAHIPTSDSRPTDWVLELRVSPAGTWAVLSAVLRAVFRHRPPALRSYRIRRVRVETDPVLPTVADATTTGITPVEIEVVPDALRVRVPPLAPGR